MKTKRFRKDIAKVGRYTITNPRTGNRERVYLGSKMLSQVAKNINAMHMLGDRIPGPFRHDEAEPIRVGNNYEDWDSSKTAGYWSNATFENGVLSAEIEVPVLDNIDENAPEQPWRKVETIGRVSPYFKPTWENGDGIKFRDGVATHIALVHHPVNNDQKDFVRLPDSGGTTIKQLKSERFDSVPSLAMSLESFESAEPWDSALTEMAFAYTSQDDSMGTNASTASIKMLLDLLRQLPNCPINLPDDTNTDNLVERMVVAINAVNSANQSQSQSVREPSEGSEEKKPESIAMSLQPTQDNARMLASTGAIHPDTQQPFTEASALSFLQSKAGTAPATPTVQLSAEQQALINFSKETLKQGYVSRINALQSSGRANTDWCNHLLNKLNTVEFAMGADGKLKPNELDAELALFEKQEPTHAAFNTAGPMLAYDANNPTNHPLLFSLGGQQQQHSGHNPKDPNALTPDGSEPSPERIAQIRKEQMAMAGVKVAS